MSAALAATVLIGRAWGVIPAETTCEKNGLSCGILSGLAMPFLTVAAASSVFIFFRMTRVQRRYRKDAKREARNLVPTAGRILENVVGRDELCQVIINNLYGPDTRRAYVVVGGVGVGKTAVLVRLTQMLALANAIPVPIMLRETQSANDLDFRELAHNRFKAIVSTWLMNDAEVDRAWRHLYSDGKIVVLADGLEETLIDHDERNNFIRLAIHHANKQKLPLVIASRPHDPLRYMEAAVIELEPLSQEAALSYMKEGGTSRVSEERLDWIIETAEVAEEPLYLQITQQLHREGLLDHVPPGPASKPLETRGSDRTELRLHLMETWIQALIEGHFPPRLSMSRTDRRIAVEVASALACIGLKNDSVDIRFVELVGKPKEKPQAENRANAETHIKLEKSEREVPHPAIIELIRKRLGGISPDVEVAAGWADQLGLLEVRGGLVRFPHSVLQAFLGSRMMAAALSDNGYCSKAAQRPGREFLIAVVMYYRSQEREALDRGNVGSHAMGDRTTKAAPDSDVEFIVNDLLLPSATVQDVNAKRLDIYAAALEIDSANGGRHHQEIASALRDNWPPTTVTYDRPLEEAKRGVIRRFGESIRKVGTSERVTPAYEQLYQIGIKEQSYPIRITVAQEIGAGGDNAYNALKEVFNEVRQRLDKGPEEREKERRGLTNEKAQEQWRQETLCAWLLPLLAGSAQSTDQIAEISGTSIAEMNETESPKNLLSVGLGYVEEEAKRSPQGRQISLEMALAQGFKYAANRRRHHPGVQPRARTWLVEQATEMLEWSTFWYTQLTLLQALCLWTLREDEDVKPLPHRHGSEPEAIVQHWCAIAGSKRNGGERAGVHHPLVEEASKLIVLALREERPEKYLWIDESGVTGIVGSHGEGPKARRKHYSWIPRSTGWSVLDVRAQRLVADVLLLLNLAERGDRPEDHDRRLRFTDRPDLPPCLTEDRSFLGLDRPSGGTGSGEPGSNCKDGCFFQLCPYPAWGGPSYRVELSEPFCRNQQAQLKKHGRAEAPWRFMPVTNLRESWGKMADRSRVNPLDR